MKKEYYCSNCEQTTEWHYECSIWANHQNNHLYECLKCGQRLYESILEKIEGEKGDEKRRS
jgi:peptide methionine sulfoxide reductase MsrB